MICNNPTRQPQIFHHQGVDNRENLLDLEYIDKEILEPNFSELIKQARSVACLMTEDMLYKVNDDTWGFQYRAMCSLSLHLKLTLKKDNPNPEKKLKTPNLRFAKEPTAGFGTGFLVRKNKQNGEAKETKYLVTAAHCVCNLDTGEIVPENIKKIRVVFDYYMSNEKECTDEFTDVYEIKKVVNHKYVISKQGKVITDWALVKLTRVVKNRIPLEIEENPEAIQCFSAIHTLGYPMGMPLKYTHSGKIQFIGPDIVKHTLDTFPGNSGSPILNTAGKVIGIHCLGPNAYSIDPQTSEIRVNVLDEDIAKFGEASWFQKITPVREILNASSKVVVVAPTLKETNDSNIINVHTVAADTPLKPPSEGKEPKNNIAYREPSQLAGILAAVKKISPPEEVQTLLGEPLCIFGAALAGLLGQLEERLR